MSPVWLLLLAPHPAAAGGYLVTATAGLSGGYSDNAAAIRDEPGFGSPRAAAELATASAQLRLRAGREPGWSADVLYRGEWERSGSARPSDAGVHGPTGEVIWRPGRVMYRAGGGWPMRSFPRITDAAGARVLDSHAPVLWLAAEFPLRSRPGLDGFAEVRPMWYVYPAAVVVTGAGPPPVTGRRSESARAIRAGTRWQPHPRIGIQVGWEESDTTGNALGWQDGAWRDWNSFRGRAGTATLGVRPHERFAATLTGQRGLRRYAARLAHPGPGPERVTLTAVHASLTWAFHDRVAAVLEGQELRCNAGSAVYDYTARRVTAGIRVAATLLPRQRPD